MEEPGRLQFMGCKESDMTEATYTHTQFAPERLPGSTIRRVGGKTVYDLLIPWGEFGLAPEEAKPGLRLGFSLLVNDLDGDGTKRAYYGLFGGIADEGGHREYGYFTLM